MLARSLTSPDNELPVESLKALDWLNFFLAALLMGFGPFVAVHLAETGWAPASIGAILTISGFAGLATQVPAGELIDIIGSKRALFGAAAAARFGAHDSWTAIGFPICSRRRNPARRCRQRSWSKRRRY